MTRAITFVLLAWCIASMGFCDDSIDSTKVILSVNDVMVSEGELRLLLQDSGQGNEPSLAARQASAAVLIRQHLALKTLRTIGGEALQAIIDRELSVIRNIATGTGRSLDEITKVRGVSVEAYSRHLSWQIAWREYLKSRLTDAALKTYFDDHRERYGGREFRVSQIFIADDKTEAAAGRESSVDLSKIAATLREQSNLNAAFATAAKEYSQAASAASGGDLGWVSLDGDLPHAVMTAIRKSNIGEIIGPIRSPLGHHLLLVSESRSLAIQWYSFADRSQLRRDFTAVLFLELVRRQDAAVVRFLDHTLRPEF